MITISNQMAQDIKRLLKQFNAVLPEDNSVKVAELHRKSKRITRKLNDKIKQ